VLLAAVTFLSLFWALFTSRWLERFLESASVKLMIVLVTSPFVMLAAQALF
jgi:hypothetical protein